MTSVLVSLGSNSGDRVAHLNAAVAGLSQLRLTRFLRESSRRETTPVGGPIDQPAFLNSAALLETRLSAREFFYELQRIECGLGRTREERWGPRSIDLDLLLFGGMEFQSSDFIVPHKRFAFRRFVLEPAAEIASEMNHPVNGWSLTRLLENLNHGPSALALCGPQAEALQKMCAEATTMPLLLGPRTDVKLLVVTGDDSELDAFRRKPDAPPSLLLTGDDLNDHRTEVLAAIAALE